MTLAAPYPRAEDRALLGTLVEALREGATEAPPWYLSHGQRWRWLVETLMGHPLIRGGQRPRDFPADPGGRRAVASAVEFQSRRVASWGQLPGELGGPFGEWLYAFFLLVEDLLRKAPAKAEGDGPEAPATREAVALEALLWLIWQTLRAAGLHQDEGSCHKLLAGIGMSIQDAGGLTAAYNPKSPWGDACRLRAVAQVGLAAEAALSAATAPRAKPLRHHREPVRALLKTRIWILTVKGFEIQKYIARTQTFWLARGASAWASQCLAEVRETLLELSEEGVIPTHLHLVTDVDAVVRFACLTEPDCGLIQAALEERIGLAWSRGDERFARKHPRLASFLDSLPAGLTGDLDPRCCLPHLCLERSAPRTLRQFCCRTRSKTEEERDEEKRARSRTAPAALSASPGRCPARRPAAMSRTRRDWSWKTGSLGSWAAWIKGSWVGPAWCGRWPAGPTGSTPPRGWARAWANRVCRCSCSTTPGWRPWTSPPARSPISSWTGTGSERRLAPCRNCGPSPPAWKSCT